MGFFITKLKEMELNEYIGSQTIYSCADNGAFDCEVSIELKNYANSHENVMAIVDELGVDEFMRVLKSGKCHGRDISKLIEIINNKYKNGFMIVS